MTIPVSSVVPVNILVGAGFPARAGFGTALAVTAETGVIGIAERVRFYSTLDGVSADWPASSEISKLATSYFSQQPRPTSFKVATRYPTAQAAQLRGGSVTDTTAVLAVADGSFTLSIDGSAQDITALNFTDGETDLDDIAASIQAALQAVATGGFTAATCTHDGSRFYINSGTTGATSTISFMSAVDPTSGTDISSLLQMRQGEGTKTDGIAAETITASLTVINDIDDDWYGLLFTNEIRDLVTVNSEDAVLAAATWCEARTKVFFNTSNDLDVLDSVTTNDIGSLLSAQNFKRTMSTVCSYPTQYPSAAIMARAFTVNFNQANSAITLKFKQMPGITPEKLTASQKSVLDSKRVNALITIGSSDMFAESFMAQDKTFFDEVHGLDWLQNAIQMNVFGYLYSSTAKAPYTDAGVAGVEQQMVKALQAAVSNGLIAPGTLLNGEFLALGYKTETIPVANINQGDRELRNYPGLSATIKGAGAMHRVEINVTFER